MKPQITVPASESKGFFTYNSPSESMGELVAAWLPALEAAPPGFV